MTPLTLWLAVGSVTLIATSLWAIMARETGVFVTSGLSYTGYSWLALTGGDVAMMSISGTTTYIRDGIPPLQFVATAMAIVSLLVFTMRLFGAYPSPTNNAANTTTKTND